VVWWAGKDSNLGSRWQQIYSLPPLSTWVPAHSSLELKKVTCWFDVGNREQGREMSARRKQTIPLAVLQPLVRGGLLVRDGKTLVEKGGDYIDEIVVLSRGPTQKTGHGPPLHLSGGDCIALAARAA
jgi:hypothetical protein